MSKNWKQVNRMSDDLISRKVLVERVKYLFTHTNEGTPEHYAYGVVLNEIRELPMAFDRQKVLEELRQNRSIAEAEYKAVEEFGHDGSELLGKATAYNLAIAIVEKGGIE